MLVPVQDAGHWRVGHMAESERTRRGMRISHLSWLVAHQHRAHDSFQDLLPGA
jgi:hypothetical protein